MADEAALRAGGDTLTVASHALRTSRQREVRRAAWAGWLFVAAGPRHVRGVRAPTARPDGAVLALRWNGIGRSRFVGIDNYVTVLTDPDLVGIILNAFKLILFFSVIPVVLGLLVGVGHPAGRDRSAGRRTARTVLFLPQVIPLVAAGIVWSWMLSTTGLVNQVLSAIGLGGVTRAWLGDFGLALPAVGVIGAWVLLGLCTVLLLTGMSKIDPALYESARIDGATAGRSSARSRCRACATRSASASR